MRCSWYRRRRRQGGSAAHLSFRRTGKFTGLVEGESFAEGNCRSLRLSWVYLVRRRAAEVVQGEAGSSLHLEAVAVERHLGERLEPSS